MSTSPTCSRCGKPLEPDQVRCTACPTENVADPSMDEGPNVADPTVSESTGEDFTEEIPASSILGVLLVVASCCVAIATTGLLAFLVISEFFLASRSPQATGSLLPMIVSTGMWAAIGYSVAYGFFYLGRARLYPGEYSASARFQRIMEETQGVDISEITPDNFYADASPQELYQLYQALKTKPDPKRLAEIAFEVRYRSGQLSQPHLTDS